MCTYVQKTHTRRDRGGGRIKNLCFSGILRFKKLFEQRIVAFVNLRKKKKKHGALQIN